MSDWPLRVRIRLFVTSVLKRVGSAHVRAHRHSSKHRPEIEASALCGCFYCLETFEPNQIEVWVDDDDCAICPRCGIDSVIGSASGYPMSREFLKRMHQYWFERTVKI